MTSLEDLGDLFSKPSDDWPPAEVVEREPRKHRHVWVRTTIQEMTLVRPDGTFDPPPPPQEGYRCERCDAFRDETRHRRGKSSRRLGHDQERRIERVYGPVKIGERGDPVDHLGRVWRWQSKATRALPPKWLVAITEPTGVTPGALVLRRAWMAMSGLYDPRHSVVIRSFVARGVRTRDWLFVSHRDAYTELGIRSSYGFVVIPGDWWLDHFGRDE